MIQREAVRQTLLQFLRDDTALTINDLPESADLRGELQLDSVDFVGLIMRIEGEYRIRLVHQELEQIHTLSNLLDLIEKKTAETVAVSGDDRAAA